MKVNAKEEDLFSYSKQIPFLVSNVGKLKRLTYDRCNRLY